MIVSASAQGARPLSAVEADGRFYGYMSWPLYCGIARCNDALLRAMGVSTNAPSKRSNYCGANCQRYGPDGRLLSRYVAHGNTQRSYNPNGSLRNTSIRRGNGNFIYDSNGRLIARGFLNSGRVYDIHGRYTATR